MRSSADLGGQQTRRVLRRAMGRRCPSCGAGDVFTSWFKMRERCPVCHWWFERGDGYFIGATCVNILAAEAVPFVFYVLVLVFTWPAARWLLAGVGAAVLAVITPLMLYPFARMLWLAIDLIVRPIQPDEYARPHALD